MSQPPFSDTDEVPAALRPFIDAQALPGVVDAATAARHLAIVPAAVAEQAHKRQLLAWHASDGSLQIPAEQILGPGHVVPGIADVLGVLGDPEFAWAFLDAEQPFADGLARPIDRLKAGELDAVVGAAQAFGDSPA